MKKLLLASSLISMITAFANAQSVPSTSWIAKFSSIDSLYNAPTAIDANGNVYVAGYSLTSNCYDFVLIKYDINGVQQWVRTYNGTANGCDQIKAMTLDAGGNIYITGNSPSPTGGNDYVTIMYNSNGTQQWLARYNGPGNGDDTPSAIVQDNGDVYITGSSLGTTSNYDYATVKYNSNGVQQWASRYNGTGNGEDRANAMTISSNGRLFVTGKSRGSGVTNDNIVTIRYKLNNGSVDWTASYNGTFNGTDEGTCLSASGNGNDLLVGGSTESGTNNSDYITLSYNQNSGAQQWATIHNGYGFDDRINSLAIDGNGDIVVTGTSFTASFGLEYHTIKYNGSGVQQWIKTIATLLSPIGITSSKVVVDFLNNVYVGGDVPNGFSSDYAVISYQPNGTQNWVETYNGGGNGIDKISDITVDNLFRIFVTGQTQNGSNFEFTTIRYDQTPVLFPPDFNSESASKSLFFYENKGQLINSTSNPIPQVKFYTNNTPQRLFFTDTSLSYVFAHLDTIASTTDSVQRIDMKYVHSVSSNQTASTRLYPFEQGPDYLNYFQAHIPSGVVDVQGYKRLLLPNVWPNIDLHYYSNEKGLKYYFVVKPGGNANDIVIRYTGSDSVNVNTMNGELTISSKLGSIIQKRPTPYLVNFSGNIIPINNWQANYIPLGNNTFKFNIGSYNTNFPLVIQVDQGISNLAQTASCDWSTYYGGTGTDDGYGITADQSGNVFMTGQTNSPNLPNITGFSTTLNAQDAFLVKFNSSGVPQWGTFYAGTNGAASFGVATGTLGPIYIVGLTSSNNLPLMPANNSTLQGVVNGYIAKFSPNGNSLLFARYFGGNFFDEIRSIAIDGNNNAYIVGYTRSNSNFPIQVKSGGYNQTTSTASSSASDAFIAEFDPNNNLIWSTFFGGDSDDDFSSIRIGANNSVLVSGSTISQTPASSNTSNTPCGVPNTPNYFPDCDPGGSSYFSGYSGSGIDFDAIIVEFDQNSVLKWSTYFGGQGNEESSTITNSIAVSPSNPNTFYLVGSTTKITGFPVNGTGGAYIQVANFTGVRAYMARFNSRVNDWATVFGASPNTFAFASTVDNNNNLYVVGHTQASQYSSSTCTVPPNELFDFAQCQGGGVFFQPSYHAGANGDGFISAFNPANQLIWSTYYGGGSTDYIRAAAYDGLNSRVYITGLTISTGIFPLLDPQTGNYQQNTNGGGTDSYIGRFCTNAINVSVHDHASNSDNIFVFPNPANTQIILRFPGDIHKISEVRIFNSIGEVVLDKKQGFDHNGNDLSFDISTLGKGIYLIYITSDSKAYTAKFVKE